MSKKTKVTGKMLKDLINEVMNEQRLNEIDISITNPSKWKDLKKDTGISNLGQLPQSKSADALKALNDLAGLDNDGSDITDDDLKAATGNLKQTADQWYANSSKTATERSANPTLDAYLASLGNGGQGGGGGGGGGEATPAEITAAGLTTTTKNGKLISNDSVTKWGNAVKAAIASDIQLAQRLHKSFETLKYTNLNKSIPSVGGQSAFQKVARALAAAAGGGQQTPADLQKTYDSLIAILNKDISGDERFSSPLGRVDIDTSIETSAGALASKNQLKVAADSSMVELFKSIKPNTDVSEKLTYLSKIGDDINNQANLSSLNEKEALEYANALTVYNYIANLSKSFSAQAAGYELEKVLSLLLLGAQVGGSNGAADVVSFSNSGKVFYSAKLLVKIDDLKQARGGPEGVDALVAKGPIIYVSGVKATDVGSQGKPKGASTEYNRIYWYIFKVNDANDVDYLDGNGNWAGKVNMSNTNTQMKVGSKNYDKFFATMPVLKSTIKDESAIAVGNRIAQFVDNFSKNALLQSVKGAATRLQNMEANTIEYRAVAAGGTTATSSSGLNPADYVAQVAKDFTDIKADFKKIFDTSISGASSTDLSKFNESKKVTPNLLKKLISENFKK
jgi:hypothetical protein